MTNREVAITMIVADPDQQLAEILLRSGSRPEHPAAFQSIMQSPSR